MNKMLTRLFTTFNPSSRRFVVATGVTLGMTYWYNHNMGQQLLMMKGYSQCQQNKTLVEKKVTAGDLLVDFVININGQSSVKYLLSQLRDKNSNTFQFRFFSDRIMRLLVEEAINWEPKVVEKRLAPTGEYYDHYKLQFKPEDYCAITIIRAGDSMIAEVMNLLPGITIGKVLIQRDEESEDKRPILYYSKLPDNLKYKQRVFILDPMLATGGSVNLCI